MAAEFVLAGCDAATMKVVTCGPAARSEPRIPTARAGSTGTVDALGLWDDNRNGRIACTKARHHGIAPVPRGRPA